MTNHLIDRGADGFGVAVIADIGRHGLLHMHDVIVAQPVQLVGGDAGFDVLANHVQHIGGQCAGAAQLGEFFLIANRHGARTAHHATRITVREFSSAGAAAAC